MPDRPRLPALARACLLDLAGVLTDAGADAVTSNSPPGGEPSVRHRPEGRCVLRVVGVRKGFRHGIWPLRRAVEVLKGADLEVCAGELVGLVGENGSGKSTLMGIVVGMLGRDAGEVQRPERLGYCPQTPMLWEKLTVDEHFELFARAYGLEEDAQERAVGELLGELQFERYRRYRVGELSGGTRQKLNLALALMHEPELLLLDEPYSGFDWETLWVPKTRSSALEDVVACGA